MIDCCNCVNAKEKGVVLYCEILNDVIYESPYICGHFESCDNTDCCEVDNW